MNDDDLRKLKEAIECDEIQCSIQSREAVLSLGTEIFKPEAEPIAIPTLGTELTLIEPWVFTLFREGRNDDFMARYKGLERRDMWGRTDYMEPTTCSLPIGTKLVVDRIYIRRTGKGEFDSVTFRLKKGAHPTEKKRIYGRFWAKLYDVNRIVCKWNDKTMKRDCKVPILEQLAVEGE